MDIKKSQNMIWPTVSDLESARRAAHQGVWAATYVFLSTTVMGILGSYGIIFDKFGFNMEALVDAALIAMAGFGIIKMCRTAAILGLSLHVVGRIVFWLEHGSKNPVVAFFIIVMFINSVRGTFAYHRLAKSRTVSGV